MILAGDKFQDTIDNNLDNADIICLCVSANFLYSKACQEEQERAIILCKTRSIRVIPIILSDCGWLDLSDLSNLQALPDDGKEISSYSDHNKGWKAVYDGLKNVIVFENKLRCINISNDFKEFLNDAGLLAKAHAQKVDVKIEDIYVAPNLIKYIDDIGDIDKRIEADELVDELFSNNKLLIAGENQAGKTTLCKNLFKNLRERNYFPVYLSDRNLQYLGIIANRIKNAFNEQYENINYEELDMPEKIIPIIDDFHFARKKEKIIEELDIYCYQILIVDEIFSLNIKNECAARDYKQFKILEYTPSLRNELIKKWIYLNNNPNKYYLENDQYKTLDAATDLVNSALGKIFSGGIMPSYPFFILTVLSTYETLKKPLDHEITSQGYCYQALIYLYLQKEGVKSDEIDIYINFLSVIGFYIFKNDMTELTESEFESFIDEYKKTYNLPIEMERLLGVLQTTKMLFKDSCGNYSFCYPYLFYYFVAKYLSDHIKEQMERICEIISNLHNDKNAYIAIFISHHTKSHEVLDEIVLNSMCLFDGFSPATLSKDELSFFDDEIDTIINASLPPSSSSPEVEREKRLELQELLEKGKETSDVIDIKSNENHEGIELVKELRRSIKTIEVMGQIVKNRSGSLEQDRIEQIIIEGLNLNLRILSSFFELIKKREQQQEIVSYLSSKLDSYSKNQERIPDQEKLRIIAEKMFWNLNFYVIYGYISIIIKSLGSDKLQKIINKISECHKTPASILFKYGVLMWYGKNLQYKNIAIEVESSNFSETAKKVMHYLIVNFCSTHKVNYKEKQGISSVMGIPEKRLISADIKRHSSQ